jgi:integrase
MQQTVRETVKVGSQQREKRFPVGTDPAVIEAWKVQMRASLGGGVAKAIPATVKVGTEQRQKTFAAGTDPKTIEAWKEEVRRALRVKHNLTTPDTLRTDIITYLALMKAKLSKETYASRECHLQAWLPAFGDQSRHTLTLEMIHAVRDAWTTGPDPYSGKTCNHRTFALKHLYRQLGVGRLQVTPLDKLDKLPEADPNPQFVDVRTIKRVASRIVNPKTRGRFMVLASTGQRPAQLKRAERDDVDLRLGLWKVRPAKRGNPIPVVLTTDMKAAFRVFAAADAWGPFDSSDYAKQLYKAGWPKHIRPYNTKHTIGLTLADSNLQWEDIKDWFGHKDVKTTRIYTGHVVSRLRRTSEKLAGRIGW